MNHFTRFTSVCLLIPIVMLSMSSPHGEPAALVATNNATVTRTSTTSATIAAVGTPPPERRPEQLSRQLAACGSRTPIGTRQSKTFVRLSLSVTCGGIAPFDIQWMRWSCHSKRPVLPTC